MYKLIKFNERVVGTLTQKNERLAGLDIIKILSMILVITVHVLGVGGAIASADNTVLKAVLCLVQGISMCSINLFAMASGFLHYGKKPHISGIMTLCLQGFFWLTLSVVAVSLYTHNPAIINDNIQNCIHLLTKRQYWYLTDYFVLFFLMPILDAAVNRINLKYMTAALLSILFATSVIPTVFPYVDFVSRGYSVTWLAIMYLIGAYIRKYNLTEKAHTAVCFMLFAIFSLFEGIYSFISYSLGNALKDYYYKFSAYNCVFVVVASVSLFLILAKIKIRSGGVTKVLKTFSSASFSVYLIHCAPVIYDNYIVSKMRFIGDMDFLKAIGTAALVILGIYFIGTVLGMVQNLIFKILHIPNLFRFIENKIYLCYDFLYRKYFSKLA